jgi:flagellar M-ring protein FliF
MPENDGTLLSKNEDSSASVMLTLNGEMSRDSAAGLAKFVKTALGNATSESVFIIDSNGNVLFSGEDDNSLAGNARNQLEVKQQYENRVKQEVEQAVLGTSLFDSVKVIPNLELDFSETTRTNHRYSAQDGMEQGLYSHRETYSSESTGGMTAAPPGTDANDTTYVTEDGAGGSSTYAEERADYLPDESIENVNDPGGRIVYEQSTIAVVATKHVVQRQEDLESQGLLDGISFAQYQAENDDRVKQEVDAELITMVSRATGIPEANVSIIAYDVPFFVESEGGPISATDILQIVLIVLILALLGFVVFRSMRADKATEEPVEELSVEQLLATTQEQSEVPEFELDKKSEVAEMIERFVDENPEAVANLLRNWLTEDWG